MLRDSLIALIRTGVAAIVGALITWLVSQGVEFPEDFATTLTAALFAFATALYNWLVILLQTKVHPAFGWLLGFAKAPSYGESHDLAA